jgi:lysophospholipase L1-like esterase
MLVVFGASAADHLRNGTPEPAFAQLGLSYLDLAASVTQSVHVQGSPLPPASRLSMQWSFCPATRRRRSSSVLFLRARPGRHFQIERFMHDFARTCGSVPACFDYDSAMLHTNDGENLAAIMIAMCLRLFATLFRTGASGCRARRLALLLAGATCSSAVPAASADRQVHVILVGDSTVAHVTGYGDALCARFDALTKCDNLARGGRSSKSYRAEGFWDEALSHLGAAGYRAYVLIQFGHNDQPGKAERSTTLPEFRANMHRYVDEVRAAGAIPVLLTPLARRSFRNGALIDGLGPWAQATAAVARESGAALLDLHRDSMAAIAAMGAVEALSLAELPPPDSAVAAAATGTTVEASKPAPSSTGAHVPVFDYTHLGSKGGAVFSRIVATEIAASVPDLARHLSDPD